MPAIYQGDKKIVDRYVGETTVTRAYQGDKIIFDAYSEFSDTLPLYVRSRASQGLKNYIIYGESVQDGTPTPEEPVEVTGLGVRTKNLVNLANTRDKTSSGVTFHVDAEAGTITITGDGSNATSVQVVNTKLPAVTETTNLYMTGYEGNNARINIYCWDMTASARAKKWDGVTESAQVDRATREAEIQLLPGHEYVINFRANASFASSGEILTPMIRLPSESDTFIPYGYKIPITVTSNGTTTDYSVYIGNDQLMEDEYVDYESGKVWKRYSELTLSGYEDNLYYYGVYGGGNLFYIDLPNNNQLVTGSPYLRCNRYKTTRQTEPAIDKSCRYRQMGSSQNLNRIYICDNNYNNLSDYRAYLGELYNQGTPLKIEYLLKNAPIPTDPSVPFPDITLPQSIVTIDIEGELKPQATVKGRINSIHYAYRINPDTAEITYLADNEDFTPAAMGSTTFDYGSWENAFFMPKPCMLKSDGTVDYYLDPNDYSKKLDGTASDIADPTYDGNVMMEFPKIWYKFVPTGEDGEGGTFHCSNVKLDDTYECWCNYDANNNEIDHFYVAAYNAVILDGKMRSLSGYALTQENGADSTTGTTEIVAARANNQNDIDEWYTYLLADHQLLTYLATLICKHVNHQAKFGRGIDSDSTAAKRAYVTGTLNDKGLFWGDTSSGTQAVKIFGIENFYACVWKRTACLIGTSTGYAYKLTHGTKDGSTATSFNTTGSGYKTLARTRPANGYVTTMRYEANGFWIPATTGTNRYGDYYWTGNGYVLVGGSSNFGAYCGSWCVRLDRGVSSSDWHFSSALSCKPRAVAT